MQGRRPSLTISCWYGFERTGLSRRTRAVTKMIQPRPTPSRFFSHRPQTLRNPRAVVRRMAASCRVGCAAFPGRPDARRSFWNAPELASGALGVKPHYAEAWYCCAVCLLKVDDADGALPPLRGGGVHTAAARQRCVTQPPALSAQPRGWWGERDDGGEGHAWAGGYISVSGALRTGPSITDEEGHEDTRRHQG